MKKQELETLKEQLKKLERAILNKNARTGNTYFNSNAPYINNAITTINDIIKNGL